MGLALGGASDLVVAGLGVAPDSGAGHGVQGAAAAVESVAVVLAAADLDGGDPGKRGERGLAADPPVVGSADQQLRGDDRADAGLGEQRRAGRVLGDQR